MKSLKRRVLASGLALALFLAAVPAMASDVVEKFLQPAVVCIVEHTPAYVAVCYAADGTPSWIA